MSLWSEAIESHAVRHISSLHKQTYRTPKAYIVFTTVNISRLRKQTSPPLGTPRASPPCLYKNKKIKKIWRYLLWLIRKRQ